MSFLEELEQNKNNNQKQETEKTPRQLWESCFKYFKHFVSILQKDKSTFQSEFNIVFLNLKKQCLITGPYEIKRTQTDDELKLELTLNTQLNKGIKINRKDARSAEILKTKLAKDSLLSTVKSDKDNNHFIELNTNIRSIFRILLKNNKDFYLEYFNINSSTRRSIKLPLDNINEEYMDKLAKYLLGQNPSLYTETISDVEITKIREKIEFNRRLKEMHDQKTKEKRDKEKKQHEIEKSKTFKEKSKRYFAGTGEKIKSKLFGKITKSKSD